MADEYVGAIVLYVDSQEVEVVDLSVTTKTGRKLVKTMNRKKRAAGFVAGTAEFELSLTVAMPVDGDEPDWDNLTGAKLTIFPATSGGQKTSYLGCFSTQVGEKYSVDNEARRDIAVSALDKKVE